MKFFIFVQALEEEKEEEEEDAQQVFKITYLILMFKLQMFGLAQILIVPKAGWREREGGCQGL